MKLLIIGNGGREHAFAWTLQRQNPEARLFIAPGNAGTAELGENLPIGAAEIDALVAWAVRERPDFTVVGPEAPLCAGVVDRFEEAGLAVFGPNAAAARLEGSKVFTKELLLRHGLPTAPGRCFSQSAEAYAYSQSLGVYPQVLKADGLAAGKGVIIAENPSEAAAGIHRIMDARVFGDAGRQLLIEDFIPGREMSIHVLTDGESYRLLPVSQDHKKLLDDDRGPNTGGMGAYAPAPFVTPELQGRIALEVVEPVLEAFRKEGIDFRGILYIGLIWTKQGPRILEFNVRGGDPETQILLPLVDTPLLEVMEAVRSRRLGKLDLHLNARHAVTVVMAAGGYPGTPETGAPIDGLEFTEDHTCVFHAGTKRADNRIVTAGGRVLSVTGWAFDLATARDLAYRRAAHIQFSGAQMRGDIAARLTLE